MKKENLKIKILVGIPASGKSTWANDFIKKNPNWVRVGRDSFRFMLKDVGFCEPKIEKIITNLVEETIAECLSKNLNVIVDNTHVKISVIEDLITKFKYSADIEYQVFDISLSKAIERDNARDKKVGEDVIKKMYEKYKILIDSFHFQPHKKIANRPVPQPDFKSRLVNAVIFDIDGTLALMGDRHPYDFDKVWKDDVNHLVAEQVNFHRQLNREIIIVSGRDKSCMYETLQWLTENEIHYDRIYLRQDNDTRNDTIVKREIFNTFIRPEYNVICVYDDRLSVVNMWYNEGLFVFNVNQGMHRF